MKQIRSATRAGFRSGPSACLLAILLLAPLTPVLVGCGKAPDAEPEAAGPSAADSGIVRLDAEQMKAGGIVVDRADSARIDVTLDLPGEVRPDPQRVVDVHPRFPGVLRELRKAIGQSVRRGEVLAMVESNESLTRYAVPSAIAGRVIARPVAPGQIVTQETVLFTVTDLSLVWVEIGIYPNQMGRIRAGQSARVTSTSDSSRVQSGTITYVASTLESDTRVALARIVLPNPGGRWEPGMFVNVAVTIDRASVAVAVPDEAIVRTAEGAAVFVVEGAGFRQQPVETGRSDGRRTEILSGLQAGTPIVSRNAYVLKSELEKSEIAE